MMLAIVSSVWVMSEAQCLVPSTEQEGPFVEELTGLLCLDAYPCPYEENCPTCMTLVLRSQREKYYLTGSVAENIDAPTDGQYIKVVVSGITGNNEYYNWLKVEKLRYSEEPVTTNIQTHGYVENESGTRLEGIRVIVHTADRTVSDTVYTHEEGEFVSTIKGIAYPVASMQVTVSDVSGRFKEQTKSTTYTYECGVEFNPETDTGLNSKELLFVLQEKEKSASLPSLCDEWHMLSEPFECGLPACDLKTTIFQAATDTIINHVFYRKLEDGTIYIGALREGDNSDIYYIPASSEHEYLMYAFNAHVGDTLENLWIGGVPEECPNGYVGVVTGISDGEQPEYTILGVENERGEITWGREWVKGVGFKDNPTGPLFYLNAAIDYGVETILCAYKDGQQVYASSKSEKFGCTYNGLEPTKPYFLCDEWNVLEVKNESDDEVYETHKVRLAGDTILTLPGGYFPRGVKVEQDGQYVGTMRTGNKHDVYYIPAGSTHEYLLYNFDAKVGGSLSNLWCGGRWEEYPNGLSGIVKEISDSNPRVFTIELEYYLPYGFTDGTFPYTIYWIDGVGMPNGPISQECPYFCEQQQVLCAYKNGEQVYASELSKRYGCQFNGIINPDESHTDTMPYLPMFENTSWTMLEAVFETCFGYTLNNIKDTIIGEKTYRKFSQERVELVMSDDMYARQTHFLREDIEERRIYKYNTRKERDTLLYDFSLQVGDSLPGDYTLCILKNISYIENAGITRRKYSFVDTAGDSVIWIEGIGNIINPIISYRRAEAWYTGARILCVENEQETVYDIGDFYSFTCDKVKHSMDSILHQKTDTIPLYIKDGPGTSTVEPVDPNQIIVTLNGDKLTIQEYLGIEIGYVLTKAPSGNNMPARNKEMASDTFSESVSIHLTESGLYTLTLTSPEWSYSIVGTFEYDAPQGVEIVETSVPAAQKILRDGQLLIRKGDKTYTITGTEIR